MTLAIAAELAPVAFLEPELWQTPYLVRTQARLQADALKKARRILRIVRLGGRK